VTHYLVVIKFINLNEKSPIKEVPLATLVKILRSNTLAGSLEPWAPEKIVTIVVIIAGVENKFKFKGHSFNDHKVSLKILVP